MKREIGSNFWEYSISGHRQTHFWWEEDGYFRQFYKSGRNAFLAAIQQIHTDSRKVLFPEYHCETESDPWYEAGWEVGYYPVSMDFAVNPQKLERCIRDFAPAVIVIQSYFGRESYPPQCDDILKKSRESGTIIIEDITQSLLSDISHPYADFYVASLRKFLAVPDGGVLISRQPLTACDTAPADPQIPLTALQAYSLKAEYFRTGLQSTKDQFRQKYVELNSFITDNHRLSAMSVFSGKVWSSIAPAQVGRIRRENFSYLYRHLEKYPFLFLPMSLDNTWMVPLYLPVFAADSQIRMELQAFLAERDIYCPIIWRKPLRMGSISPETEEIYSRILCFPIDQRYDQEDMDRIDMALSEWKSGM